jgi:hypothetical protein
MKGIRVTTKPESASPESVSTTAQCDFSLPAQQCILRLGHTSVHSSIDVFHASTPTEPQIEESALRLFHALRCAGKLDAAQAITCFMEIYYYEDGHLMKEAADYLEILAGISDQDWPAIIGGIGQ